MDGTTPRYVSFVIRIWQHDAAPRVDVEHIQTGDRTQAVSLAAAMEWMGAIASGPEPAAG